jgi:hypothetical protein
VPWRLAELVEAAVRAGQVGVSAAAFERLAHLRTRHDALSAVGVDGFAERARRELLATGQPSDARSATVRGHQPNAGSGVARARRRSRL